MDFRDGAEWRRLNNALWLVVAVGAALPIGFWLWWLPELQEAIFGKEGLVFNVSLGFLGLALLANALPYGKLRGRVLGAVDQDPSRLQRPRSRSAITGAALGMLAGSCVVQWAYWRDLAWGGPRSYALLILAAGLLAQGAAALAGAGLGWLLGGLTHPDPPGVRGQR